MNYFLTKNKIFTPFLLALSTLFLFNGCTPTVSKETAQKDTPPSVVHNHADVLEKLGASSVKAAVKTEDEHFFPHVYTDVGLTNKVHSPFQQKKGAPLTYPGKNGVRWVAGVDCAVDQCVALTYDDGPGKFEYDIFSILDRNNVPATFFYVGNAISGNEAAIARGVQLGMEIANHSWSHPELNKVEPAEFAHQIDSTNLALENASGYFPQWVRPPYGAQNANVLSGLAKRGQSSILWDIDTLDWKNKSAQITTEAAVKAKPGSIVLVHSVHESTRDATQLMIDGLRSQGYILVSVDQLLEGKDIPAGSTVYSRNKIH